MAIRVIVGSVLHPWCACLLHHFDMLVWIYWLNGRHVHHLASTRLRQTGPMWVNVLNGLMVLLCVGRFACVGTTVVFLGWWCDFAAPRALHYDNLRLLVVALRGMLSKLTVLLLIFHSWLHHGCRWFFTSMFLCVLLILFQKLLSCFSMIVSLSLLFTVFPLTIVVYFITRVTLTAFVFCLSISSEMCSFLVLFFVRPDRWWCPNKCLSI